MSGSGKPPQDLDLAPAKALLPGLLVDAGSISIA
jgi:hypothetical protein